MFSYEHSSADRPARTYVHQFCANTGCSQEDPPGTMNNRDGWRERERERGGGSKNFLQLARLDYYDYYYYYVTPWELFTTAALADGL